VDKSVDNLWISANKKKKTMRPRQARAPAHRKTSLSHFTFALWRKRHHFGTSLLHFGAEGAPLWTKVDFSK